MLQFERRSPYYFAAMMKHKITVWSICICLGLFLCALETRAQSGRRQPKVEPAAPIPTPTPEPTPKPKPEQKDPELFFVVGADRNGTFSYYPYSYFDAVVMGVSEMISRNSSAAVDPSTNSLSRGDAIKKAKSDPKTYVVYLELITPTTGSTSTSSGDQIELSYTVFAPSTGKVATSGRTYQVSNRGPIVRGPTGTGGVGLYREQFLRRAGQDAGARILSALHLEVPAIN